MTLLYLPERTTLSVKCLVVIFYQKGQPPGLPPFLSVNVNNEMMT